MVTNKPFGTTKNGIGAVAYTIANECGIAVTVLDYGATLQSVVLPRKGKRVDVVLGYDSVGEYERSGDCLGASIGRFAGRIPDALLRIGREVFPVPANEGRNHLHGGDHPFHKRVWNVERVSDDAVHFSILSPDGDEGYPGRVRFDAFFTLLSDSLEIRYLGVSNRATAWNPTNHAYWNLNGHDAGDARKHRLEIPADRFVPVGTDLIPTGGEEDVSGTRFDFRSLREIGGAYDHSFVLSGNPIRLWGTRGIGMEIATDCKAVQLYNAECLTRCAGKGGAVYGPFGAVCLETEGRQTFRHTPIAEENVLTPDRVCCERVTKYKFLFEEE